MGHYLLPDLRDEYGALEPHIAGRIMQLQTEFFQAVWKVWNWPDVEALFEAARGGQYRAGRSNHQPRRGLVAEPSVCRPLGGVAGAHRERRSALEPLGRERAQASPRAVTAA